MADSSVQITAGSGTPIRVLTGLGATSADQQVVTLADSAGNLLGTTASPLPTSAGIFTSTGTISALNGSVGDAIDGGTYSSVKVQLSGTWSGTVAFQGSVDGVSWYSHNMTPPNGTQQNTTTFNQIASTSLHGRYFRVLATAWTSGTATVTLLYAAAAFIPNAFSNLNVASGLIGLTAGTNYIGNVRLTDGTNAAAVKAASTAAVAADTAQVVALHPSSPAYLAPSTLVVTATAAAATAVTATLAAPGAGLSHYITAVRIERFMTAAGTGAGTATLTGGTNHALVFNLPTDAATIGTQSVPVDFRPTTPLKVTAAATATTFTAPAVTATIYRITVAYYIAA